MELFSVLQLLLLTKETRVQSRVTSSDIRGKQSGTEAGFSQSSSVFPR
jgi:hypothetical protein